MTPFKHHQAPTMRSASEFSVLVTVNAALLCPYSFAMTRERLGEAQQGRGHRAGVADRVRSLGTQNSLRLETVSQRNEAAAVTTPSDWPAVITLATPPSLRYSAKPTAVGGSAASLDKLTLKFLTPKSTLKEPTRHAQTRPLENSHLRLTFNLISKETDNAQFIHYAQY